MSPTEQSPSHAPTSPPSEETNVEATNDQGQRSAAPKPSDLSIIKQSTYTIFPKVTAEKASAKVKIRDTMNLDQWGGLRKHVTTMIAKGVYNWEFDMECLQFCTSTDLGMWVASNATVENLGGTLKFRVKRGTSIEKLLNLTKLDHILDVDLF